ncbi:Flp family type IVb pilin [Altererythrobacter xixiisoli]|uniref:Flp family type IVb pilin n=1 Tax=Croceibacterium xixiisoli TaxID=1476466 RepID=A0A6I4TS65_9SPHN|nr:Flp family type IVb pilin [Croceibacterium xixiisoli]MXO98796.1 Flp family type IVb pilin [Croceibacterium xixiisoli]
MNLSKLIRRLTRNEHGGTAIEYGLIVSLVVIAIVGAMKGVADENIKFWGRVETSVKASTD